MTWERTLSVRADRSTGFGPFHYPAVGELTRGSEGDVRDADRAAPRHCQARPPMVGPVGTVAGGRPHCLSARDGTHMIGPCAELTHGRRDTAKAIRCATESERGACELKRETSELICGAKERDVTSPSPNGTPGRRYVATRCSSALPQRRDAARMRRNAIGVSRDVATLRRDLATLRRNVAALRRDTPPRRRYVPAQRPGATTRSRNKTPLCSSAAPQRWIATARCSSKVARWRSMVASRSPAVRRGGSTTPRQRSAAGERTGPAPRRARPPFLHHVAIATPSAATPAQIFFFLRPATVCRQSPANVAPLAESCIPRFSVASAVSSSRTRPRASHRGSRRSSESPVA